MIELDPADMTDEQASEVKLKKESVKAREEQDAAALVFLLSCRPGRRMLYRMLENCGMFNNCIGSDRDTSLVLAGGQMKAVALWAELIATSPAMVGKMIEENAR